MDTLLSQTGLPAGALKAFETYSLVLVDHYVDLFKADGADYDALVRSAYRNRGNYLIFLNRLGQVEKELDKALAPGLAAEHPTVGETIAHIEAQVAQLRRGEAERVFS